MVTSEAVPFGKTGGLADVLGALPPALARRGHEVRVIVPRYRQISLEGGDPVDRFPLRLAGFEREVRIYEKPMAGGARALLVDCPDLFDRDGLYAQGMVDYPDNALRFGFLAKAALTVMQRGGERPSIVHAHDWQTGLVPLYLKVHLSTDPLLGGVPVVFTIHNVAYQGLFAPDWLPALELGWELLHPEAIEFWGQISLLKAGVNFADALTTVSRRHAREILTPQYGYGFDGILQRRKSRLVGIRNGIDVDTWNPATDPFIPEPYSAGSLAGKQAAKRRLLETMGLPVDAGALERPLVGVVSRMVDQKGFDLLAAAAPGLLALGATYVVLGSGAPEHEVFWRDLAASQPDRVATRIGFDEALAHLIEAGADMFLMPSRYEPCGMNQMYSQRYGTVPIVRATGGLFDTVANYSERTGEGTGFTFTDYSAAALERTVARAVRVFGRKDDWRTIQRAGMVRDFSWDASAAEYVKVYRKVVTSGLVDHRERDSWHRRT